MYLAARTLSSWEQHRGGTWVPRRCSLFKWPVLTGSPEQVPALGQAKCKVSVLFCWAAFVTLIASDWDFWESFVAFGEENMASSKLHTSCAVLGQMSCQAKANVQNSLYCSWSRNTDGPSMKTIFHACCTTVCYRLMICHRFIAFKRLFMNSSCKRTCGLRGAAEHLCPYSPFAGYMNVTEKKLACLWPLIQLVSSQR